MRALIARKRALFAAFPDVTDDDLAQTALAAVIGAWRAGKYDPAKSAESSFIYCVASRQLLDLARTLTRRRRRDHWVASQHPEVDRRPDPAAALAGVDADDNLAGWCGSNYRSAKHAYGVQRVRIGRRFANTAQVAAIVLLLDRLDLSPDAARAMLVARPDVMLALRLRHLPTVGFLTDVRRLRDRAVAPKTRAVQIELNPPLRRAAAVA